MKDKIIAKLQKEIELVQIAHLNYEDIIYGLGKAIKIVEEATEWIKSSERLPEVDTPCLVMYQGYIQALCFNSHYQVWDDADGDDYRCDLDAVSHWMPFPNKPEDL